MAATQQQTFVYYNLLKQTALLLYNVRGDVGMELLHPADILSRSGLFVLKKKATFSIKERAAQGDLLCQMMLLTVCGSRF